MDRELEISLLRNSNLKFVDEATFNAELKRATAGIDYALTSIMRLKHQLSMNGNVAYFRWVLEDEDGLYVLTSMDDFESPRTKALLRKFCIIDIYHYSDAGTMKTYDFTSLVKLLHRASAVEVIMKNENKMLVIKSRYGATGTIANDLPWQLLAEDELTAASRYVRC